MTDKELQKIIKKLTKLNRQVDGIGPLPLRQSINACLTLAIRLSNAFDLDRFENNINYAEGMFYFNDTVQRIVDFDYIVDEVLTAIKKKRK